MAVPETDDPAVVVVGFASVDLHKAEVALAFTGQGMSHGSDFESGGVEAVFDLLNKLMMPNRVPGLRRRGCNDFGNFITGDMRSSAMKNEVGMFHGSLRGLGFEMKSPCPSMKKDMGWCLWFEP